MHLSAVLLPFCVQHQQGNTRMRKNNWWAEQSRAKYKGRVEGRRTETRETREVRGFHESSMDVLNGPVQNCLFVWLFGSSFIHSFFLLVSLAFRYILLLVMNEEVKQWRTRHESEKKGRKERNTNTK